jgi:nucleotide-binding universal stress UspA family protein
MKILCATDFSPRARSAANVALELARRTHGSVELVHVHTPRAADLQALAAEGGLLESELRSEIGARLDAYTHELAGVVDVRLTSHLGEGNVEEVLLARARAVSADLIVVGARGHTALERLILGSTAERMVRGADRPVLIVPPGIEGLVEAGGGKRALRVLAAVDGRRTSDGGVAFVRRLRASTTCDVTVLRLYWPVEEYQRLGLTGPCDLTAPHPAIVADLGHKLRAQVDILPGAGETHYSVEPNWGDPAAGILVAASERACDLIVMGAESRHGWGRIAHPAVAGRVARRAFGVPVVFVPAAPAPAAHQVPPIATVLAPTDLSPAGNRAVLFAYAMVAAPGGVVELCHVHERALADPPFAYDRPQGKLDDAERSRLEAALRALVPPDAERRGITTHVTVIDGGRAGEAIAQAAERFVADAVVLGSQGSGGARWPLIGRVSQAVMRHTRRPVLVVPGPLDDEVTAPHD